MGLGSILRNGPYNKYVPLNFFKVNTHQSSELYNINRNRLYDFLKTLINKKNQISLSFCDCKLILLYILNYKINLLPDFTYEEKNELFKKLKQKHISSHSNTLSNFSLLKYTTYILNRIYGPHNIDISPNIITCSHKELLYSYMSDKNYKYLFNENEIRQILSIFKKAGDLVNDDIKNSSFIFNKKPDSSNA